MSDVNQDQEGRTAAGRHRRSVDWLETACRLLGAINQYTDAEKLSTVSASHPKGAFISYGLAGSEREQSESIQADG